jgi:hypothetical protein
MAGHPEPTTPEPEPERPAWAAGMSDAMVARFRACGRTVLTGEASGYVRIFDVRTMAPASDREAPAPQPTRARPRARGAGHAARRSTPSGDDDPDCDDDPHDLPEAPAPASERALPRVAARHRRVRDAWAIARHRELDAAMDAAAWLDNARAGR